jgi:hypothetical protein
LQTPSTANSEELLHVDIVKSVTNAKARVTSAAAATKPRNFMTSPPGKFTGANF